MSRGLPQAVARHVWRRYESVSARDQLLAQPVFHHPPDRTPLGMPEDQAWPGQFLDAEQVQLLAEFSVVTPLGLLQPVQVGCERFLGEESRAVDALQLLAFFVAFPIRPGHR